MPAIINADALAQLKHFADAGDKIAMGIVGLFEQTFFVQLTPGTEGSNKIRISGQVVNQEGKKVAGARDVLVSSVPISGAGTLAQVTDHGTVKAGGGTTQAWVLTLADGSFQLDVSNTAAEDNLIKTELDNGTVDMLKLTFA
jgi:hypothetical protein